MNFGSFIGNAPVNATIFSFLKYPPDGLIFSAVPVFPPIRYPGASAFLAVPFYY